MQVQVAIIGLNRIGASFGLALKRYQSQPKAEHRFTIIGSDPKAQPMKSAKKINAIDNFNRAVLKAIDGASLVIVNAPFGTEEEIYSRIGPALKPGTVVLDTSILKQPVIEWANRYFPKNASGDLLAYLVGITPIVNAAGLYSGDLSVDAARADLFDGSEFLVTPDTKCPSEAIALAEDVVHLIGANPRFMDPVEHDGLIAATEELPALLGAAVFYMLRQSDGWMELRRMVNPALGLTMQNLRDQSAQDLFALFSRNRENLARHLETLIGVLDQMHGLLTGDLESGELEAFLTLVQKRWEEWDIKRYSGKWDEMKSPEIFAGPLGSMGGFLTLGRRKKDKDGQDTDES